MSVYERIHFMMYIVYVPSFFFFFFLFFGETKLQGLCSATRLYPNNLLSNVYVYAAHLEKYNARNSAPCVHIAQRGLYK